MKKNLLIIFSLFISTSIFACSCDWGGNFIKTAKKADLVLTVKVIEENFHLDNGKTFHSLEETINETFKTDYNGTAKYWQSVDLEVLSVIKGISNKKKIRLFGSFGGAVCRSGIRHLKKGKSYVIVPTLSKYSFDSFTNENEDDYFMWGCSETSIEYKSKSDKVYGLIKGKSNRKKKIEYEYERLIKRIT